MSDSLPLLAIGGAIFVVLAVSLGLLFARRSHKKTNDAPDKPTPEAVAEGVEHFFNDDFREELRNRGRLHFEKIITENAMFLKQDLDVTISQLNEMLQKEISGKLGDEFAAYAKAMQDAQALTLASLSKSVSAVEAQNQALTEALAKNVAQHEAVLLSAYEKNMARIVEHYLLEALGSQFDLKSQLPAIIAKMDANKQSIMDDMRL